MSKPTSVSSPHTLQAALILNFSYLLFLLLKVLIIQHHAWSLHNLAQLQEHPQLQGSGAKNMRKRMIKHPKTGTCKRSSHNTLEPPCSLWSRQSDCPVLCCAGFKMYYRWVASVKAGTLGIASSQICSGAPNCFSLTLSDSLSCFPICFSCWTAHSWGFVRWWFPLPWCRQNNTSVSKQIQASAAGEHSAYSHSALVCSSLLIPSVSLLPSSLSLFLSLSLSLSSPSHSLVGSDFEAGASGWQIDLLQTDDGPLQKYSEPGIF